MRPEKHLINFYMQYTLQYKLTSSNLTLFDLTSSDLTSSDII